MFIDSTHVKANANKKKYRKTLVEQEPKNYQSLLEEELNQDRINHGKKPLPKKSEPIQKEVKISTTDPYSGWFVKDEKEQLFAYSFHEASDKIGFILGAKVIAANVHDSQMFQDVLKLAISHVGKPYAVAIDAGYKTPYIAKPLLRLEYVLQCHIRDHEQKMDSLKNTNISMTNIMIVMSALQMNC